MLQEQGRVVWEWQVITVHGKAPQLPCLLTPKETLHTPAFSGVRTASSDISRQGSCGVFPCLACYTRTTHPCSRTVLEFFIFFPLHTLLSDRYWFTPVSNSSVSPDLQMHRFQRCLFSLECLMESQCYLLPSPLLRAILVHPVCLMEEIPILCVIKRHTVSEMCIILPFKWSHKDRNPVTDILHLSVN